MKPLHVRTLLRAAIVPLLGAFAATAACAADTSPGTAPPGTRVPGGAPGPTSTQGASGTPSPSGASAPTTGAATDPANANNAESKPTAGPGSTSPPASGTAAPDDAARKLFDTLDTNHDGVLSFEEFARASIRQR